MLHTHLGLNYSHDISSQFKTFMMKRGPGTSSVVLMLCCVPVKWKPEVLDNFLHLCGILVTHLYKIPIIWIF